MGLQIVSCYRFPQTSCSSSPYPYSCTEEAQDTTYRWTVCLNHILNLSKRKQKVNKQQSDCSQCCLFLQLGYKQPLELSKQPVVWAGFQALRLQAVDGAFSQFELSIPSTTSRRAAAWFTSLKSLDNTELGLLGVKQKLFGLIRVTLAAIC